MHQDKIQDVYNKVRLDCNLPDDYKFVLVCRDSNTVVNLLRVWDLKNLDGANLILVRVNPKPLLSESGAEAKFAISRASDLSD